ncbi:MAG: HAMP domain-containing histidine kinase, partial [Planctomycetes bacterium]|nr:HAMP domain-containing histidine kinase [Planctomycetota bacterium]
VVRNAIRYTAPGTEVQLSVRGLHGAAQVLVRDHGPGVPADALEDIFRPFYRLSDARERDCGGAGLGLAIAQQAVRIHGGTIRASNAPDGGLIVEIRLPALGAGQDPSKVLVRTADR